MACLKFTKNCQIYQHFPEFIQTKNRYPTSLDKICILTQKLLVISSSNANKYNFSAGHHEQKNKRSQIKFWAVTIKQ